MNFDLESIQKMWEKDAKIDIDNLHQESLNIPILHAKYFELYNTLNLLKKKAEKQRSKIYIEKYEYYTGKADPEVYIQNPFPKKIRDKEMLQKYMDSDVDLSNSNLKIEYYDVMINYLQEIIKTISNRSFQIKNSIDYLKFTSGLG